MTRILLRCLADVVLGIIVLATVILLVLFLVSAVQAQQPQQPQQPQIQNNYYGQQPQQAVVLRPAYPAVVPVYNSGFVTIRPRFFGYGYRARYYAPSYSYLNTFITPAPALLYR